jgi:phage terminase large subunit-like protein
MLTTRRVSTLKPMARSRTSARTSAAEKASWTRRAGNPGGARSEAQKLGLEVDAAPAAQPWEASGLSRVERVIVFLEALPITAGILAGERMRLLPGQRAFVEDVYGSAAVRIGVKSEPRGNGKTGLVAGLALCHLLGPEAEPRGQVFSASIDRGMAALVFADMAAIIQAVASFALRVNIQRFHKKIEVLEGAGAGSVYEALSADVRRAHSLRPSLWIYDELAQAKDGELLGNLRTAMGKTARSLGLVISTQAPDDEHPLSQLIDDGLSGLDPSIVVHLTTTPPAADPFDPATIRAVNPAFGVFLDEAVVMAEAEQARRSPVWEPKFRNLRLNQRVDADTDERLAQAADWRRCEAAIDLARLEGRPCVGALDLSSKHDLTALVLVFPDDEVETGYDVLPFFWTPAEQLHGRPPLERERLAQWIRAGHVEAIAGPIVRYRLVGEKLAELARRFDVQTIAYDRWRIEDLQAEMAELDLALPLEPFGQGHSKVMAPAIEFFTELVVTERLRHGGNPALTASVLNAEVVFDTSGNPKLDKSRARRGAVRIDGAVALVMALGMARRLAVEHVEGRLVVA